jgi:hypothetical protein
MRTILERVIKPETADLTPEEARAVLRWHFEEPDRKRMSELVLAANARDLTDAEQAELEEYRRVGTLLDLMHAKARLSIRGSVGTSLR